MDLSHRWLLFKEQIKQSLSVDAYEAWLAPLELVEISSKKVIIAGIPHPLFREDIIKNYDGLFRKLFTEIFSEHAPFHKKKIKYCLGQYQTQQKSTIQGEFSFNEKSPSPITSHEVEGDSTPSIPAKEKPTLPSSKGKVLPLTHNIHIPTLPSLFDPKHSLDNFIVGNHNRLAYEAGCRIIRAPGAQYNPFFIYSMIGLGKTHLLEAIGQGFSKLNPKANTVYVTAESFLNEFVTHLQQRKMNAFRQRFRQADLLLLDNVQTIANTKNCQEELLHTIETLQKKGKQIVISSNELPRKISNLDSILCSRLESGLMADISSPDLEARMGILQNRAKRDHIHLPSEVCYFIAHHIFSNVRKMEGALIRLGAHASLLRQKISLEFARTTLVDLLERPLHSESFPNSEVPQDQIERILDKICTMSQVTRADLQSGVRANKVVRARQMGMYLIKELTDMSLSEIGQRFGNRTHSAIHSSLKQIKKKMETDDVLRQQLLLIKNDLSQTKNASQISAIPMVK